MTKTPTYRCGWCPPAERRRATEQIVWTHHNTDADGDCWASPGAHNHVSYACADHTARDVADLRSLGFHVIGVSDL